MKKILIAALLLVTLYGYGQQSELVSREFWQAKPDLALVKTQVSKGFDFKDVHGSSDPVFLAISSDASSDVTKYLIDQPGVDLSHTTVEGRIYLHVAANKGNAEITDYLLAKGSDMNFLDANGHTALSFTGFQGALTPAMIDVFIKHGHNIKHRYNDKDGANILLLSVGYDKDLMVTDYLVSKGVSIHATDDSGNTAFDHAAKIGNVAILKALIAKGVKYTDNALFLASQGTYRSANKIEVYQYLVEDLKMNPLMTNKAGQNVLHGIVRKQNQTEIIRYFFTKGVDINKTDKDGNTPFMGAVSSKSLELAELMLPKVKNINAKNTKGETALLNAVKASNGAVVSLLVKSNADINVLDKEGNNLAFHLIDSYRSQPAGGRAGRGAQNGAAPATPSQDDFTDKLNVLKENGLNLAAAQKNGNTLYHLAISKNDVSLLKKISSLGIDINARNKDGVTALHKAVLLAKNDAVIKYLIEIGASKDIKTDMGETAYELAGENEFLTKNNISIDFLK